MLSPVQKSALSPVSAKRCHDNALQEQHRDAVQRCFAWHYIRVGRSHYTPTRCRTVSTLTDNDKFTDYIPDMMLIERLRAGRPDAGQLRAIIARSYEYIRNLPLKGLIENYTKVHADLAEPLS